jgi:hypothetical protein
LNAGDSTAADPAVDALSTTDSANASPDTLKSAKATDAAGSATNAAGDPASDPAANATGNAAGNAAGNPAIHAADATDTTPNATDPADAAVDSSDAADSTTDAIDPADPTDAPADALNATEAAAGKSADSSANAVESARDSAGDSRAATAPEQDLRRASGRCALGQARVLAKLPEGLPEGDVASIQGHGAILELAVRVGQDDVVPAFLPEVRDRFRDRRVLVDEPQALGREQVGRLQPGFNRRNEICRTPLLFRIAVAGGDSQGVECRGSDAREFLRGFVAFGEGLAAELLDQFGDVVGRDRGGGLFGATG